MALSQSLSMVDPPASAKPVLVLLEPAERGALEQERNALLAIALPDELASPREYEEIAKEQERVQRFIKQAKPAFDDVCDNAHKTWKAACRLRSLFFDSLEAFNARARTIMGDYTEKQERIRRDEERRLSEQARKDEEERRRREVKLLEKQGQKELAAAVRSTPVDAPAIALPSAVPVVQGLSYREDWKWQPVSGTSPQDYASLVNILPREYLKVDDVKLNGVARSMKGTLKIPGIRFFCEKVAVRR